MCMMCFCRNANDTSRQFADDNNNYWKTKIIFRKVLLRTSVIVGNDTNNISYDFYNDNIVIFTEIRLGFDVLAFDKVHGTFLERTVRVIHFLRSQLVMHHCCRLVLENMHFTYMHANCSGCRSGGGLGRRRTKGLR